MSKKYEPADLSKLRTYSAQRRAHKFDLEGGARLPAKGASFSDWWDSLPAYLGAKAIRDVAAAIIAARRADRPVVWAVGAHVVKVGCAPIVCDLLRRKLITAVAMNGATAIHDVEVATLGQETPNVFGQALARCDSPAEGLGAALGRYLAAGKAPHRDQSILATAHELGAVATVHVAIGTDTIHMHQAVAESELAQRSMIDFRLICSVVADMAAASAGAAGGAWCNIGSAVLLPEVFLKAVAVARNLGRDLDAITTADFDMQRHYRPGQNVIGRPVKPGRGHAITGHHEIMLPLLRQALVESA
jgi:hypothetical protein